MFSKISNPLDEKNCPCSLAAVLFSSRSQSFCERDGGERAKKPAEATRAQTSMMQQAFRRFGRRLYTAPAALAVGLRRTEQIAVGDERCISFMGEGCRVYATVRRCISFMGAVPMLVPSLLLLLTPRCCLSAVAHAFAARACSACVAAHGVGLRVCVPNPHSRAPA